jgi:hypothetical protein
MEPDEVSLDQFIDGRGDQPLFLQILSLGDCHLALA